jgi:hypothetical protein
VIALHTTNLLGATITTESVYAWVTDVGSKGAALLTALVSTPQGALLVGVLIVAGVIRFAWNSVRRGRSF